MENFPPFEFEQNGSIIGFDTEIIELVLQRIGYTPDIQKLPWARAQKYGQEGKVAAVYSLVKSPEREKFYYFSDPLSAVRDVIFKHKDKKISWTALQDLKGYSIGVSHGYHYSPHLMRALEENRFLRIDEISGDNLELRHLQKIKAGRIDICICEVSVCQYLIKTHAPEFDMIDYIDKPVGDVRPYFIGFSKKWPGVEDIVRQFNVELSRMVAQGRRKAIFEKYGVAPFNK